jgi:hypothetical protein
LHRIELGSRDKFAIGRMTDLCVISSEIGPTIFITDPEKNQILKVSKLNPHKSFSDPSLEHPESFRAVVKVVSCNGLQNPRTITGFDEKTFFVADNQKIVKLQLKEEDQSMVVILEYPQVSPSFIRVNQAGDLWITETTTNLVKKYSPEAKTLVVIGTGAKDTVDGSPKGCCFDLPSCLSVEMDTAYVCQSKSTLRIITGEITTNQVGLTLPT